MNLDCEFRGKEVNKKGGQVSLHEADGGMWVKQARENIKQYLQKNLPGSSNITIC